jgi:pilus assembly protein CpaB
MGRTRGLLWLVAGLVVALLAAYITFNTLARATAAPAGQAGTGPQVELLVAKRSLPMRTLLTAEDVELKPMPADAVPADALSDAEEAIGRLTTVDLYQGEVLVAGRLLEPNVVGGDGRTALFMAEDEVLVAIPAQDQLSRAGVLKTGDRIDLLFSLDFPVERVAGQDDDADEEPATFSLLQNLPVVGLLGPKNPGAAGQDGEVVQVETILLTVTPQDALTLKYAFDTGGIVGMALRAPGVERTFETEPVDVDYVIKRYEIPIEVGR